MSSRHASGTPPASAVITNQFASSGVVFGKAGSSTGVAVFGNGTGNCFQGSRCAMGLDANGNIPASAIGSIFFNFVDTANSAIAAVTDSVSFYIGDSGGDLDEWDVTAFDINGSVLSSIAVSGTSHQLVNFTMAGIHAIEIDFTANLTSGYFMDSLAFNAPTSTPPAIPLPASLPLLTVGLGLFGLMRKRRG